MKKRINGTDFLAYDRRAQSGRSRSLPYRQRRSVKWDSQIPSRTASTDVYTSPRWSILKKRNHQGTAIVDEVTADRSPCFNYCLSDASSISSRSLEPSICHRIIFKDRDAWRDYDSSYRILDSRSISGGHEHHVDMNSSRKASHRRVRSHERSRSRAHTPHSLEFHQKSSGEKLLNHDHSRSFRRVRSQGHSNSSARSVNHSFNGQGPAVRRGDGNHLHSPSPKRVTISDIPSPRLTKPLAVNFNVHVYRVREALPDISAYRSRAPRLYLVLLTREERVRTDMVDANNRSGNNHGDDVPFNSSFLFTSTHPEREFLLIKLIAAPVNPNARPKLISKCTISLQNLTQKIARYVSARLVRHAGTRAAYECGVVQLRILSDDLNPSASFSPVSFASFSPARPFSREAEAACRSELRDLLRREAPERLHRLDYYVGRILWNGGLGGGKGRERGKEKGPGVRAAFAFARPGPRRSPGAEKGATVFLTLEVRAVWGLSGRGGGPAPTGSCRLLVRTPGRRTAVEGTGEVPYHRRAVFNRAFQLALAESTTEGITIEVFSGAQKLCVAEVGLFNLRAGVVREVSAVLVRGAGGKDAAHGGEISFTLSTENYTSPLLLSYAQERRLRERVLGFLWCYKRADLHRLEAILAGINNIEHEMREWARVYGPEPLPKCLSLNLRRCRNIFSAGVSGLADSSGFLGGPRRLYVWVSAGPIATRTELASSSDEGVSFTRPLELTLPSPEFEVVELFLVEEIGAYDREVSRVQFGLSALHKGVPMVRCLHLIAHAKTIAARVKGEIELELTARDFGIPAGRATEGDEDTSFLDRMEVAIQRCAPGDLHRVPLIVERTPSHERERVLAKILARPSVNVTAASMIVRIIGVKDYQLHLDCYVKVYLGDRLILRTHTHRGATDFSFHIDDQNETVTRFCLSDDAMLRFEVKRHRLLGPDPTIASGELALSMMVSGAPNKVWLPLFKPLHDEQATNCFIFKQPGMDCVMREYLLKGDHLKTAAAGARFSGFAGYLGVMLQSAAFPIHAGTDSNSFSPSTATVITRDVETLLQKFLPGHRSRAQVFISRCLSVKEAHWELRARLCPLPVGLTIFLTVEAAEDLLVDVRLAGDRQWTWKGCGTDLDSDFVPSRCVYPQIRLDIVDPTAPAGGEKRTPGDLSRPFHAPFELRLLSLGGGAASSVGIHRFHYSRTASAREPSSEAPFDATDGAEEVFPIAHKPASASHTLLGNKNHISNYLNDPISCMDTREIRGWKPRATKPSPLFRKPRNDSSSLANSHHASARPLSSSALLSSSVEADEIGLVKLSLRALLSRPPDCLSDPVRVPVVSSSFSSSAANSFRSTTWSSSHRESCVVGFITFRLALPAFEVVPAWMKLGEWNYDSNHRHHHTMEEKNLARAFDDERCISAYLRGHSPTELMNFHYNFYEREEDPVPRGSS